MKFYLRLPFVMLTMFLVYLFIDTYFKNRFIQPTRKKARASETKIVNKYRKAFLKRRMQLFVLNENITALKRKPTRKRFIKEIPNTNYRLSRLLYQLWDPNNYQNQGSMLSCGNLVSVDDKKYRQGRRFARKLNRKFYEYVNVSDIWEAIKYSCLPVKNIFQYKTPNFGPASYPIAYTITLDRTAEQSLRMLASIYHHDNIYCVHPNAKFGLLYMNIFKRIAECIPNIVVPEKIFAIRVKTYNHLKAEVGCFSKLLKSNVPWKYGINLPSSSFPLRNNTFIVKYLRSKPYETSMTWELPNERFMRRVRFVHVLKETEGETLLLRTAIQKSPPPDNLIIFRKGMYFISTRNFYTYITESNTAQKFLDWVEDTKSPEDFYYATLYRYKYAPDGFPYDPSNEEIQLKKHRGTDDNVSRIPPSDLMLSLWKSDGAQRCHGQYRGHVCTFGAADLRWLIEQDYLFAISFDYRVDRVSIDCLTKHLKQPILSDTYHDENDWPTVKLG
ncbi:beta-1,3-galactosyl-O-glycosyl-glycoprotein beta-1,6-N-acetylglucosaminyltransferase 3-like [Hydractinia symbiolongicarpus]|uniref:beta-1,3-galactosyl-O-glycosyl-glycoprotein beta-1,6-N-acetylglucosaminyltransferase 3-like n=1 Tax=Hydractinia symbiolongicarpus TaxID=13093 RepID=UPI00255150D8|nr:beta-1,3-galactosyl-O-glycosyl-glycoprotein beta-1,6-N-acetylglucosaminyltransferase 3-like [Hydractinia symbiolongicarpus]